MLDETYLKHPCSLTLDRHAHGLQTHALCVEVIPIRNKKCFVVGRVLPKGYKNPLRGNPTRRAEARPTQNINVVSIAK